MIIILEGASGIGKSTTKLEYFRDKNDCVMIDRFTPSNYVYGKLKNRNSNMDKEELLRIDRSIAEFSKIVHLQVSPKELDKRSRGNDFDYNKVESLYNEYYKLTPIPVFKIDITGLSPAEVSEKMGEVIWKKSS